MPTRQNLRQLAEVATEVRVRRDREVEDQENTVAVLARMLRNAEAVLTELRSDLTDAVSSEAAAWHAVELEKYR
jgi:hypothetical protein